VNDAFNSEQGNLEDGPGGGSLSSSGSGPIAEGGGTPKKERKRRAAEKDYENLEALKSEVDEANLLFEPRRARHAAFGGQYHDHHHDASGMLSSPSKNHSFSHVPLSGSDSLSQSGGRAVDSLHAGAIVPSPTEDAPPNNAMTSSSPVQSSETTGEAESEMKIEEATAS
jgi:hypothetical protein